MDVRPSKPLVIHVPDEDTGAADQLSDARVGISHKAGDQKNPIIVEELQVPRGGDRNHPISVEEEDNDSLIRTFQQGCDFEHPISVDHYGDDALLRLATANSRRCQAPLDLDDFECFVLDLDVPKGKSPVRVPLSLCLATEEVGESSSAPPSKPEAYCAICMEAKFPFECFSMKGCDHMYCTSCVSQYVAAKVEDNLTSIDCPDPECRDGFLEPEMCRLILPPDVFDRWGNALCEMTLSSIKFYCPYKDCSALLIDEGGDDGMAITDSECPHCFRLFCVQCKVPWHTGFTCKEYGELGPERATEDLMLIQIAKTQKWQRCPKCYYFVERIAGCMFMRCRCGIQFCYSCASETKSDHFCARCMPNFNLQPHG